MVRGLQSNFPISFFFFFFSFSFFFSICKNRGEEFDSHWIKAEEEEEEEVEEGERVILISIRKGCVDYLGKKNK